MTNYSQGKFIDWAFRSKVGGSNGSQRFGSISFDKTLLPICMHITMIRLWVLNAFKEELCSWTNQNG